ncbi:MAG: glycosyltransferase [Pseudomonadota bacterium]
MRILFVIHYCSPDINDNSFGPIYLGSVGHQVLVISSRHANSLKGDVYSEENEVVGGCTFYRPYQEWTDITRNPGKEWPKVKAALDDFNPEVVIGFGEFNYKLSLAIRKRYQIPYFLFMEYLRLEKIAAPIRGRTLLKRYIPFAHDLSSRFFLKYLAKKVTAVMFSYFGDQDQIQKLKEIGLNAYYVPWCTDVGGEDVIVERRPKVGLYIGALEKFKNSEDLIKVIPYILEQTETEKFIVVGPGPFSADIKELQSKYGERLEYIESMPRQEALKLIRSVAYGFTPVSDCGLGFLGDCWGCGTPLITTHELDGFINKGKDASVANNIEDVPLLVKNLLDSPEVWKAYHSAGLKRYELNYTAKAVGDKYLEVMKKYMN